MKVNVLISAVCLCALVVFVNSCKKEDNSDFVNRVTCNEADDSLNTYNGKIKILIDGNCAKSGCHDAISHEEGIDLSTYNGAVSGFNDDGLCTIYREGGCKPMPQGASKLSDPIIHDLTCWVKNNYPQ